MFTQGLLGAWGSADGRGLGREGLLPILGASWPAAALRRRCQDRALSPGLPASRPSPRSRRGWEALGVCRFAWPRDARVSALRVTVACPGVGSTGVGAVAQAVAGAPNPALAGLPTLGEVTATTGLMLSTQDFLTFLGETVVQGALAPYHIGAAEVAEGKQLQAAWDKARGKLSVARGSETNSQRSNIGAREAFADWLGTWWGIARVRLAE